MKAIKREISCYSQWETTRKKNSQKFLLGLNLSLKILIFSVKLIFNLNTIATEPFKPQQSKFIA